MYISRRRGACTSLEHKNWNSNVEDEKKKGCSYSSSAKAPSALRPVCHIVLVCLTPLCVYPRVLHAFSFFTSLSSKVTINEISLLIKKKKQGCIHALTFPFQEEKTTQKEKRWNVTQFAVQITRIFSLCLNSKKNKTKKEMEERRPDKRLYRSKRMVRKRRIKKNVRTSEKN